MCIENVYGNFLMDLEDLNEIFPGDDSWIFKQYVIAFRLRR